MLRKILPALLLLCLNPALFAQTGWTTVTASHQFDGSDPSGKLNGKVCLLGTDSTGKAIPFQVNSNGQSVQTPFCAAANAGIFASLAVPDAQLTAPKVCYQIKLSNRSGVVRTDIACPDTSGNGGVTGSTWNYDAFVPSTAHLTNGQSVTDLAVQNLDVAHCTGAGCSSGGSTPGGAAGAIQYNSGSALGGAVVTGLIKGNGTSAPTAAVAGTDYQAPIDFTAPPAIGGTTPADAAFIDLRTKITPVANVRAPGYGAVGNGVADDAPAVHAATDAIIAAGGGTVYFPKGTYYLNTLHHPPFDGYIVAGATGGNSANHLHFECAPGAVLVGGSQILGGGEYAGIFHLGYAPTDVNEASGYAASTIPSIGASSITLTTPANAANFVQGDVIYLRGADGQDGQPLGEFDYVASANATTGVVTLVKPLGLPYPTELTAVKATSYVFRDVSIEGCEVHNTGDFAFIGQVIGTKIKNNRFFATDGSARASFVNSFEPLSEIEVTGNYFHGDPATSSFFIQIATGWSDWRITNNIIISGAGSPLEITEGASNGHVIGNSIYSVGTSNTPLSFCQMAYGVQVTGNLFMASGGATGVTLGCSSGVAINSTFSGNTVIVDGISAAAISGYATIPIVGNTLTSKYVGISVGGSTAVTGNTIHLTGTDGYGIFNNSAETPHLAITGNVIYADTAGNNVGVSIDNRSASSVVGNSFSTLATAVAPLFQSTMTSFGNTCTAVTNSEGSCRDVFGSQGAVWLTNNLSILNPAHTFIGGTVRAKADGVLGVDSDIDLDAGKNFKVNGAVANTTVNGSVCPLSGSCAPESKTANYTVSTLPGSPFTGQTVFVTDAASGSSCATGSGSTKILCRYNGSSWDVAGGAGGATPAGASGDLQTNNGSGGLGSVPQSTFLTPTGSGALLSGITATLAGWINPALTPYFASDLPISYCNFTSGANTLTCDKVTGWVANQGGIWVPSTQMTTSATIPATGTICDHVTISGTTLTTLTSGGAACNMNFTAVSRPVPVFRTYTVKGYGASGQNVITLTATDASFVNGMGLRMVGAGAAGVDLVCPTITVSGTSATCLQSDGTTAQNIGTTITSGTPAQVWHEDTLALQNAVATGSNIHLTRGSYYCGGACISMTTPQIFEGEGKLESNIIITKDAIVPVSLLGSGQTFSNIGLFQYESFTPTSGALIYLCDGSAYCANDRIAANYLYGGWGQIYINAHSIQNWVENNSGLVAKGFGMLINNPIPYGDLNILNNQFTDCNSTSCNTAVGLEIDAADTEVFYGNKFNEFRYPLKITGSAAVVQNQRFDNNSFEMGHAQAGDIGMSIQKASSFAVQDIQFNSGEQAMFNLGTVVQVGSGPVNIGFHGMTIVGSGSTRNCVDLAGTGISFTGNQLNGCGYGVAGQSGMGAVITDNTFTGTVTADFNIPAAQMVGTNRITNNYCGATPCAVDTVTMASTTDTTTPITLVANTAHVANSASQIVYTTPATAVVGDQFRMNGSGAGGYQLIPATGQTLQSGATSTSTTGCTVAAFNSTNRYDSQLWQYTASNVWSWIGGGVAPTNGSVTYQALDLFAGTVGTALTSHTDGCSHTWANYSFGASGGATLSLDGSGHAKNSNGTSTNYGAALNSLTPSSADYTVRATFTVASTSGAQAVLFGRQASGANTGYWLVYDSGAAAIWIQSCVANTCNNVGSTSSYTWTAGTSHTLEMTMTGTTLSAKLDGSVLSGVGGTNSDTSSAGQAGLRLSGVNNRVIAGNFQVQ